MCKRIILIFCFIMLFASAALCLNFHWKDLHQRRSIGENFSQWLDDERPTLIYAMPPTGSLTEIESMSHLLLAAKKMGWNLVTEQSSHQLPASSLKNAFGIVQFNQKYNYQIPRKNFFPANIPIVLINNFVKKEFSMNNGQHLDVLLDTKRFYKDPRFIGFLAVTFPALSADNSDPALQRAYPNLKFLMNWHFSLSETNYQPRPTKLIYIGDRLHDEDSIPENYLKLWKKLELRRYFSLYGEPPLMNYRAFKGAIPGDGSFVQEINEHGICLLLHGERSLNEGVPTNHLFEALAAAALIISDRHSFIEREFKDSVLYIDESREDLFEQIENHLRWIKNNQAEAKKKARLAHAIFLQKFTQEKQLAKLYEYIQKHSKQLRK